MPQAHFSQNMHIRIICEAVILKQLCSLYVLAQTRRFLESATILNENEWVSEFCLVWDLTHDVHQELLPHDHFFPFVTTTTTPSYLWRCEFSTSVTPLSLSGGLPLLAKVASSRDSRIKYERFKPAAGVSCEKSTNDKRIKTRHLKNTLGCNGSRSTTTPN